MREFSLKIANFGKGLRSDFRQRKNSGLLTVLKNAEPFGDRLITWQPAINPFSLEVISAAGIDLVDYPYPQLFKGKVYWLLADGQRIFRVHPEDWTLTELTLYNYKSRDVEASVQYTGLPWHFVDMGEAWMLFNGTSTVFHTNFEKMLGHPDVAYVQSDIYIETGCEFRGRALYGGFNGESFWSDEWKSFFAQWADKHELGLSLEMGIAENMVWFSTIGGGDLLWLFYPELMLSGVIEDGAAHSGDKPLIFDFLRRNESGLISMPWQGRVRRLIPMESGVVVYGDHGVSFLRPVLEPYPTFGLIDEFPGLPPEIGIASYRAADGDNYTHLMLDNKGELWLLTSDLKATKLGYKEFFLDMLGQIIMINYSAEEKAFYIGNDQTTYKLRENGLCQVDQIITSVSFTDGGEVAFCDEAGYRDKQFLLTTDIIDFDLSGYKTINSIEADYAGEGAIYASIYYRNDKSADFSQTEWRRLNPDGWVRLPCSAREFKIALKCSDYSTIDPPSSLNVKWGLADKRMIRSQYVNQATA